MQNQRGDVRQPIAGAHVHNRWTSGGEIFSLSPDGGNSSVLRRLELCDIRLDIDWSQGHPATVRAAYFPQIMLSVVDTPAGALEWKRDRAAAARAVLIATRTGAIEVATDTKSIVRGTRAALVLPEPSDLRIRATDALNEIVVLAFPPELLPPGILELGSRLDAPALPWAKIAPLYNFVATTATVSSAIQDGENLLMLSAVRSVITAFSATLATGLRVSSALFDRAKDHLKASHRNRTLDLDSVARDLAVSPRTLQSAFSARSTTFTRELRDLRAAAAHKLRQEHPELSPERVAKMTGFPSLSTMYRALRTESLRSM